MIKVKAAAIIAAAGWGKRFSVDRRKQFQPLDGKPVIAHSIERFEESPSVGEIILVVSEDSIVYCREEIVKKFQFKKIAGIIPGGEERQHSVKKGFSSISNETDIVIVHDGVRPFITVDLIEGSIKEALESGGAIVAVPVRDTVKESYEGYIKRTLPRESLWLAQTPQAFRYDILKRAYEMSEEDGFLGTDESSLVERLGIRVKLIWGSQMNMKITTEEDLLMAELALKEIKRCY
ncbi:MAG: 2-C-methyl-D-erythritol 4-phosphate cytidylyltransferase [Candidatus Dadabacteria bacterium]